MNSFRNSDHIIHVKQHTSALVHDTFIQMLHVCHKVEFPYSLSALDSSGSEELLQHEGLLSV